MTKSARMTMIALTAIIVLATIIVPIDASAHHSFSIYSDEITEVEGQLVDVSWGNPHVRLTLSAGDVGQETIWTLETGSVYILERRGLPRELFQPGDRIRAAGRAHRGQAAQVWLHNLMLGDGRELLMIAGVEPRWNTDALGGDGSGGPVEDAAAQDRGLFRVWSRPVLRPIDYGEDLPYLQAPVPGDTDWIARLDGFAARCEPVGMPGVMATPYPFEFRDHGSWIQLLGFSNNARIERTIHMSGGSEGAAPESGRFGFSIGRWESGNRLEVRTTRIDWPYFDDSLGTPQSGGLETIEIFTLSNNQQRLDYEMIVADSSMFTTPATAVETHWLALGESLAEPAYCAE